MKKNRSLIFILCLLIFFNISLTAAIIGDEINTDKCKLIIYPIEHATFLMKWNDLVIAIDPFGGEKNFLQFEKADIIIITDIHFDHLNIETINLIKKDTSILICPQSVYDKIYKDFVGEVKILSNGDKINVLNIEIEAIPMYNTSNDRLTFHIKGRGNGYIIHFGSMTVYVSGDTEDILEMKELNNIDVAFICMNLPYTMDINQARDAVLAFKPKIVYPCHFRGANNVKSDLLKFKSMVEKEDAKIDVRIRDWYVN